MRPVLVSIAPALCCILLVVCSRHVKPPEASTPDDAARQSHRETAERLVDGFVDGARVVSRYDSGEVEHVGDGLIWLGVALAALPCDLGADLEAAAAAGIEADGGNLSRHPSRPDDASIDGALGFYLGVTERSVRCGTGAVWREAMQRHVAMVERTGGLLNERGSARIFGDFRAVMRLAARAAGADVRAPTEAEMGGLEAEVGGWARIVRTGYDLWKAGLASSPPACFRLHLGWLALRTAEKAGERVSSGGRASFCESTSFAGLPIVDHWCARGDLIGWIHSFRYDQLEYRHQRCLEYESPDGRDGLHTPAVDKLIAEREAYTDL